MEMRPAKNANMGLALISGNELEGILEFQQKMLRSLERIDFFVESVPPANFLLFNLTQTHSFLADCLFYIFKYGIFFYLGHLVFGGMF